MTPAVNGHAPRISAWLRARPARAGRTRVLAVEGRSGSGKSTLATAVAAEPPASVIRMDDLYPGWDGLLSGVDALVEWILLPLSLDRPARWRRYDWADGAYAEWHEVPAAGTLVVDGTGSGALAAAPYLSGLLWLEAADEVRKDRALGRDGDLYAPHWERWAAQEESFHIRDDVRARADLTIVTG
ncbi:phosphoribulokinase [Streptosporangium sp. NPDC002544]|uniref:phosphoribulokinase n=1 Tax=unclassified Streptosporangium TaxID=2632669 RepID=UPI00332A2457